MERYECTFTAGKGGYHHEESEEGEQKAHDAK
jgi:hypothetical protein